MNNKKKYANCEQGYKQQNHILGIDGNDQKQKRSDEDEIVGKHQGADPDECDQQALEDSGNGGHGGGERDGFGGVERSNCEDNSSCRDERESEEEEEITELETQQFEPFTTYFVLIIIWVADLVDDWIGEDGVNKNCKGKRENQGQGYEVKCFGGEFWD